MRVWSAGEISKRKRDSRLLSCPQSIPDMYARCRTKKPTERGVDLGTLQSARLLVSCLENAIEDGRPADQAKPVERPGTG
jgi:hypothetical protein